jgi:hypothetical protein
MFIKPNIKVALFTNARDELHIKEWAAHHLLIGFDYIIIFDHKSKISLKSVFNKFDRRVKIKNASHLEGAIKTHLMNYAAQLSVRHKIDWILYLDADEFLILNKPFIGIKHFISKYNFADSIGINWLLFGSNYLKNEPQDLILNSYTKSQANLNKHVKSLTRSNQIINATNPHFYNIINRNRMVGLNGKMLSGMPAFSELGISYNYSPAYIAHYVNQSEETYRRRKGVLPKDDNGGFRQITDNDINNLHNQFNDIDNLDPKTRYADNIKQFLERFAN